MRPQVGQVINNKYRLIRIIGDGGMGSVYEARHELLGTTVALKFLHPELSKRSGLVQRFLQEAQVSVQIQSPHVVRVIDVDQQPGGLAYIVMEYLEGKTLQTLYEDLYRAGQRLSYPDAIEYAMQMLEGVEAAHAAGIVHRDLKPDNVIITKDKRGEPLLKLLDFGIAKLKVTGQLDRGLTRPGVVMGTPEYMAPEQAYSADAVDLRADIFSLGVMIFEMLAGRRPVGGDDPHQIATAYLTGNIARLTDLAPNIDAELAAVVHKAMAAQPKDRFASVAEFRGGLERFFRTAKAGSPTSPATPMPANVTPSPAISPPPTNVPDDPQNRAVPKTIPPEAGAPEPAQGTPLGGFVAQPAADPGALNLSPIPAPVAADFSGGFPSPAPAIPATVTAAPFVPDAPNGMGPQSSQGFPGTAPYSGPPIGGFPATSFDGPMFDAQARPGGTAVSNAPPAYYGPTPGYPMVPQGTQSGLPGTAPMNPLTPSVQPETVRRNSGGGGVPMFVILLAAAAVSGVVVGGLYLGQRLMKPTGTDGDTTFASATPTTPVTADPGPSTAPVSTPLPILTSPSTPPPPPYVTNTKPPPANTGPKPPSTTTATSTPSTPGSSIPPPMLPTSFPTIVIPSSFPTFTLPGAGIPRPTVPTGPTAKPPPTSPGTGTSPNPPPTSTRPKIIIKHP